MSQEVYELIIINILFIIGFIVDFVGWKSLSQKNYIVYDYRATCGRVVVTTCFVGISLATIIFNFVWIFHIIGGMN